MQVRHIHLHPAAQLQPHPPSHRAESHPPPQRAAGGKRRVGQDKSVDMLREELVRGRVTAHDSNYEFGCFVLTELAARDTATAKRLRAAMFDILN